MIFYDHVDAVLISKLGQLMQSISSTLYLIFIASGTLGVDTNGMTAQEFSGFNPLVVILYSLLPFFFVCIPQSPFSVAHDKHVAYPDISGPLLHLVQIRGILSLVFKELVDVL